MKDLIKLLSTITGIFRSVVTIIFLLGIAFTVLVDVNLLIASIDIAGFSQVSKGLVKPILIGVFAISFIINTIITRNIFSAGTTGRYHMSNLCFGLIFIIIDAFIYVILRQIKTPLIFVFMGLNALIVINSILGLIAKSKGYYDDELILEEDVKPKEYIQFENTNQSSKETYNSSNIVIDNSKKPRAEKTNDSNYQVLEKDKKMVYESKSKSDSKGQTTRIAKKKEIKASESKEK